MTCYGSPDANAAGQGHEAAAGPAGTTLAENWENDPAIDPATTRSAITASIIRQTPGNAWRSAAPRDSYPAAAGPRVAGPARRVLTLAARRRPLEDEFA
jgi:hypothetical protein